MLKVAVPQIRGGRMVDRGCLEEAILTDVLCGYRCFFLGNDENTSRMSEGERCKV